MYRVRAEKVSGKRVFAKGVWLTCIGNKAVSVGDLIFTDGRCVYGFYQEAQQPMIITSQRKVVEGIPIFISDNCFDYEKNLKFVAEKSGEDSVAFINDYNRNCFLIKEPPIKERAAFIAANVDKQGNIFQMWAEVSDYAEDVHGINRTYRKNVKILKNDEVIKIINFDKSCTVAWGFIENENDWAFMATFESTEPIPSGYVRTWIVEPNQEFHTIATHWETIFESTTYFYSSQMVIKIFDMQGSLNQEYELPEHYNDLSFLLSSTLQKQCDYSGVSNVKFPIQDGYYYKMVEIYPLPEDIATAPALAFINIFDPSDEFIISGYFFISSKFTIQKIKQSKFLLGVNRVHILGDLFIEGDSTGDAYTEPENIFRNGLYLIDKAANSYEILKSDAPFNQRLRSMKYFQNWNENIKFLNEVKQNDLSD